MGEKLMAKWWVVEHQVVEARLKPRPVERRDRPRRPVGGGEGPDQVGRRNSKAETALHRHRELLFLRFRIPVNHGLEELQLLALAPDRDSVDHSRPPRRPRRQQSVRRQVIPGYRNHVIQELLCQ
jgi:hypothetical protein